MLIEQMEQLIIEQTEQMIPDYEQTTNGQMQQRLTENTNKR